MARPKKLNADWFRHDNNMRNHRKIKALRNKFGQVIGYGLYCMMIEILTEAENHRIILDPVEIELYAADMGVDGDLLNDFIDYTCSLGLFQFDNDSKAFSCASLTDRFADLYEKRNKDTKRKSKKRAPSFEKAASKNDDVRNSAPAAAATDLSDGILDSPNFLREMEAYTMEQRSDVNDIAEFVGLVISKIKKKTKGYQDYRSATKHWIRNEKDVGSPKKKTANSNEIFIQ